MMNFGAFSVAPSPFIISHVLTAAVPSRLCLASLCTFCLTENEPNRKKEKQGKIKGQAWMGTSTSADVGKG